MNFEELMKKMKSIDEGQVAEECGAMPIGISGPSEQQDNVTMNVSMNGSGAGGIRDLMAILKNIEDNGHEHSHSDVLVGEPSEEEPIMGAIVQSMGREHEMGEEYENSVEGGSEPEVYGIDAVTQTGDDLASQGHGALKHNGGENPMHESLVNRLSQMYNAIKEERTEEKDEKGNVVRWKEEGEWVKAKGKEGRGKVTNLSDKARRETEKMSNKEKEVAEGGWSLPPADASPEEQDAIMQKNKASQDYINKMASQQANGKDLGDGFMLTSIEAFGKKRPAVLDTQNNTYYIPNKQEDGAAIIRSPAPYITIKDGKTGSSMGGPMTNAAMKKAGLSTQSQPPAPQQEDIELAEMLKIAGLK